MSTIEIHLKELEEKICDHFNISLGSLYKYHSGSDSENNYVWLGFDTRTSLSFDLKEKWDCVILKFLNLNSGYIVHDSMWSSAGVVIITEENGVGDDGLSHIINFLERTGKWLK